MGFYTDAVNNASGALNNLGNTITTAVVAGSHLSNQKKIASAAEIGEAERSINQEKINLLKDKEDKQIIANTYKNEKKAFNEEFTKKANAFNEEWGPRPGITMTGSSGSMTGTTSSFEQDIINKQTAWDKAYKSLMTERNSKLRQLREANKARMNVVKEKERQSNEIISKQQERINKLKGGK